MNLAKFFHKNSRGLLRTDIKDSKDWPEEWKRIYFKSYPRLPRVVLPEPEELKFDIFKLLKKRRSSRKFSNQFLEITELSNLLFWSAGIMKVGKNWEKMGDSRRSYPSGGARYPLEIYLGVNRVRGIEKGVFHYNVKGHFLEKSGAKEDLEKLKKTLTSKWARDAALILVISAVFYRTLGKYQDHGYRYILLEAGHLAQNFYLLATALKWICCGLGGFDDYKFNELLDLDGENEAVLYVFALGC